MDTHLTSKSIDSDASTHSGLNTNRDPHTDTGDKRTRELFGSINRPVGCLGGSPQARAAMQPPQQHQQQHGQLGASSGGGGGGRMSSNTLLLEFFPTLAMMAVSLLVGYARVTLEFV